MSRDRGPFAGPLPAGLLAALALGCAAPAPPSPDLVLITLEGAGPDLLAGCARDPSAAPHACKLAVEARVHRWAIAAAPTAAPAVASILTSALPSRHGVTTSAASFLSSDAETLAESLRGAGYSSAAFIANPLLNRSRNLHQGFDHLRDAPPGALPRERAETLVPDARRWLESNADAEAARFVWIHLGASLPGGEEPTAELETALARIEPALRPGAGIMVVGGGMQEEPQAAATLRSLRCLLVWRPPRPERAGAEAAALVAGGPPVSTLDVAPTLLRAAGLAPPSGFAGEPLPRDASRRGAELAARAIFAEAENEVAVVLGRRFYTRTQRLHGEDDVVAHTALLESGEGDEPLQALEIAPGAPPTGPHERRIRLHLGLPAEPDREAEALARSPADGTLLPP